MTASEKSTGKRILWNGIIGYDSFVDPIGQWSINHKVGTPIDLTSEHRMHSLLLSMVPLNSAGSCTPEHVWMRADSPARRGLTIQVKTGADRPAMKGWRF